MTFRPYLRLSWFFLAFVASGITAGCYEGWEDSNSGQGKGPNQENPTSGSPTITPKLYAYLLLTPIRLASSAMASSPCFQSQDIKDFKDAEWSERLEALTSDLANITEKLVVKPVSVVASDCSALAAVRNEALKETPWAPDSAPVSDPLGRLTIHVKAVFWEGEPQTTPPSTVVKRDWTAFTQLNAKGIPTQSVHYWIISNGGSGYFREWLQGLPKESGMSGTSINQVDPTANGLASRRALVKQDSAQFVKWLSETYR